MECFMIRVLSQYIFVLCLSFVLISCSNNSGNSNSNPNSNLSPTPAFQIEKITAGDRNVRLEWFASKGNSYNLYYSSNKNFIPDNGILIKIPQRKFSNGNTLLYTSYDHQVDNNTFYYYILVKVDSSDNELDVTRTVSAYPNKILLTDKNTFVDTNLHSCVLETAVSHNKASKIKWNYLTDLDELRCSKNLTSLVGLEKLTNINYLLYSDVANLEFNDSVYLYLSNLRRIALSNIASINIDGNILSKMGLLYSISIYSSGINNFNWLNFSYKILSLDLNNIALSDSAINNINRINFPELTDLKLTNTGRANLNWLKTANLKFLRTITVTDEPNLIDLSGLNGFALPSLRHLDLDSIPILNLDWLITADLKNLFKLQLSNVGLSSLAGIEQVVFNSNFVTLDFSNNNLTNLNELFSSKINLISLYVTNNKISNINGISSIADNLEALDLYGNNMSDFSGLQENLFPELVSLTLGGNKFTNTTGFEVKPGLSNLKKYPKLRTLSFTTYNANSNTGPVISDYTGLANANLNSLTTLSLDSSAISNFDSLNGANLISLESLYLGDSALISFSGFDQMGLSNLINIRLFARNSQVDFNGLINAKLSKLKSLQIYSDSGMSNLSWFKAANFISLEDLLITVATINDINWMDPTQMQFLANLEINHIAPQQAPINKDYSGLGFVLSQLPQLKELNIQNRYNYITMDDLSWLNQNNGFQSLENLTLYGLGLKSSLGLVNQNMPNLSYLNLSNNDLTGTTELANSGMINLEEINLIYNNFNGANSLLPLSYFSQSKKIRIIPTIGISKVSCNDLSLLIAVLGTGVLDIESADSMSNCVIP